MLDDLLNISQGTLFFAFDKIMAASNEDIVAALDLVNVRREKQKIILNKEQETAVKERFVVERTVQINTTTRIYDTLSWVVCLPNKFSTFKSAGKCGTRGGITALV